MRIVYISGSWIPSTSANSVHVMKMCQSFAKRGHEVVLVARQGATAAVDEYQMYGVRSEFEIIRLPWPRVRAGGFIYGFHCSRYLKANAVPDLVYSRTIYGGLAAATRRLPWVFEAHTPPGNWLHSQLQRTLFGTRGFCYPVVITQALKREYLKSFPSLSAERIVVAHDAADLAPTPLERNTLADEFPGRRHHVQVGYVGQLYAGKGIGLIGDLASRMPEIDFHVVGGSEDQLQHSRMAHQAENLHFHGYVPHGEIHHYLELFDILLAPYQSRVALEGGKGNIAPWMSPLKIFEYMAAAKPIVCSDLPVLREVLENNVNALLVPPEDISAWAAAIDTIRRKPEFAAELGLRARDSFAKAHTWDQRALKVLSPLENASDEQHGIADFTLQN